MLQWRTSTILEQRKGSATLPDHIAILTSIPKQIFHANSHLNSRDHDSHMTFTGLQQLTCDLIDPRVTMGEWSKQIEMSGDSPRVSRTEGASWISGITSSTLKHSMYLLQTHF